MSFYSLSELKFTAPYFSAIDCIRNDEKAIYCSSEITSGWNLYNKMRSHNVKSPGALKAKLGEAWYQENILKVNSQSANHFAKLVRDSQTDNTPVITPAPLKVPDWDQPEYLSFWEELIRTRVKAVRFNSNWEYSNGCVFEFAAARVANIDTLDSRGATLAVSAAIACVKNAIEKIKELDKDFDTTTLERNLERLHSAAAMPLPPKMPPTRIRIPGPVTRKLGKS
jgi:hypothetical protein